MKWDSTQCDYLIYIIFDTTGYQLWILLIRFTNLINADEKATKQQECSVGVALVCVDIAREKLKQMWKSQRPVGEIFRLKEILKLCFIHKRICNQNKNIMLVKRRYFPECIASYGIFCTGVHVRGAIVMKQLNLILYFGHVSSLSPLPPFWPHAQNILFEA